MKKYRVLVREVWVQPFDIEAESAEDAVRLVTAGEGDIDEGGFEYSHTPDGDIELWTVEEIPVAEKSVMRFSTKQKGARPC